MSGKRMSETELATCRALVAIADAIASRSVSDLRWAAMLVLVACGKANAG